MKIIQPNEKRIKKNNDKVALDKFRKEVEEGLSIEGADLDLDELSLELFNHETNFKHCDVTTGMNVHTHEEIRTILEEVLKQLKEDSDRCSECGCLLKDEDYNTIYEDRGEHFGTPCSEEIVEGYTCSTCGHEEHY